MIGYAFGAELRNRLPDVVFVDDEVVFGKTGDETAAGIRHCGGDVHQFDAALEAERLLVGCRSLLPLDRRDGEERDDRNR